MKYNLPRMQRRTLTVVLWVLTAASVLTAILQLPATWQIPLVLLALIAIISLLNPVEEIHKNVRYLRNVKEASAPSRTFSTRQEFYNDLGKAVEQATSTLDLTHIRDHPPKAFGAEAEEYAESVASWLREDANHSARRIISVNSPAMLEWAKHLAKLQQNLPTYHIRVVDWSINAPALNMAVVDSRAVFLALTGDTVERTNGFAIEDETTAEYFTDYYSVLWHAGVDLQEYLKKQLAG